jgi:tRNA pseudouridine13 synthase
MSVELPRGHGAAVLSARMRSVPEDFRVDEVLGFEASGVGEHLLLDIEKRGANTVWVAQRLAQWAGIPEHGVSYAGLKDRHAVTRQSYSVHLPRRRIPRAVARLACAQTAARRAARQPVRAAVARGENGAPRRTL